MRIAQYSDSFLPVVDGVGRVVESYARHMAAMGNDVTVCAPRTSMTAREDEPYRVLTYGSFPIPGKLPYHVGFPRMDPIFEYKARELPFDIIHVHAPFMSGFAGLHEAKRRGIPVVGSFHSKYYDDFAQTLKSDVLARGGVRVVVDFYERCDEVWAVSGATADTLREYGYQGEIVVMPNGTERRALDSAVLPQLRERFALAEDEPILLYVGQLHWKKNIRRILEACKVLSDRGCAYRLVLAGQGPHAEEIEQAGRDMGIGGRMLFTGHMTTTRELDGLYTLASMLVFPSLYDNAPMVLREAAAMGTPALLVRGSNAAEGIIDGENGLTSEDTPEALAGAMQRGLSDAPALAAMGEGARKTVAVPWERIILKALGRYRDLCARHGG